MSVFRKDWHDRFTFANQTFLNLLHRSLEECLGRTTRDLNPSDLADKYLVDDQQVLQTGVVLDLIELVEDPKTGLRRYVQTIKAPVRNDKGEIVELQVLLWDITDRKQAEQELELQNVIVRNMADGVCLVRASDGIIVYANPKFERLFGYEPAELKGQHISVVNYADDAIAAQAVHNTITAHLATADEYTYEVHNVKKDGTPFWCRVNVSRFEHPEYGAVYVAVQHDITARKQAEAALSESLAKQQALIQTLPDLVMRISREGVYLDFISTQVFNFIGDVEDFVGATVAATLPPEVAKNRLEAIEVALETGTLQTCEQILWVNNKAQIEEVRIVPCGTDEVLVTVRDITDRRQAEAALNQSEARFQKIALSSPGCIYILIDRVDGTRQFEYVSAAIQDMIEVSAEQVLQNFNLYFEQIHPDDLPLNFKAVARSLETMEPLKHAWRIITPSGKLKWIQANSRPERRDDGSIAWYGVFSDISDRKQFEEALQKSELQYRRIVETATEGIWILDADSKTRFVNPALANMLGYTEAELLAQPMLAFMDEDGRAIAASNLERRRQGIQEQDDFKFRRKDGSTLWVIISTTPIWDENGQYAGALSMLADISDRKQAELDLQQAKEIAVREAMRSAEANRTKSIFLSNMSHELRTPLNAILGFSQLLAYDTDLNPEQQENLAIINRSGEHLLSIINDILEMSKIEAGRITFNVAEFDLFHLLDTLETMFLLKAESKGLQLWCDRAPDVPQYVQTDENKLRQVLTNLLGNAIKFTHAGQVVLTVTQHLAPNHLVPNHPAPDHPAPNHPAPNHPAPNHPAPNHLAPNHLAPNHLAPNHLAPNHLAPNQSLEALELQHPQGSNQPCVQAPLTSTRSLSFAVEDTGGGIDPEEQDSLFEPFVQSKSGKFHPEGTGLGLPISQQFVRLMGGELTATSVLNRGSTFAFQIPVLLGVDASAQTPSAVRSQGRLVLASDQPTYRILLVEDHWSNRQLLHSLIKPLGFEIQEAINGQDAVALWETWQPHLIWMDIRMPVMDGYEATRRIRALERDRTNSTLPPTKIIALTANAFEDECTNALAAGCDAFVRKPLQAALILAKIAEHLGVRYVNGTSENNRSSHTLPIEAAVPAQPVPAQPVPARPIPATPVPLSNVTLQQMPIEWLLHLHRASTQYDAQRLHTLIEQIPAEHDAIAQALREAVNRADFAQVIQLVQDATGHHIKHF